MNIKLTLGERLKDLRVERNLKLEALAEQTGLSKSALSKYESDDVTDLSICQRKHSKPQCWSGSDPANAEKEVCSR